MTAKRKQITKEADQEIETHYSFFKKTFQIFSLSIIIFFLSVGSESPVMSSGSSEKTVINVVENKIDLDNYPALVRQKIKYILIEEVEKYMNTVAPESKLSAELLVNKCQEYEMNIVVVIAQAVLESHIGTKGKAAVTNSVFNVGALDNGQVLNTYSHPNESVEPFLQLIQNEYLGPEKQLYELLKDGGYKNLKGQRYASARQYESQLRTIMIHININSSISMYQDILNLPDEKILTFFAPVIENDDNTNYLTLK